MGLVNKPLTFVFKTHMFWDFKSQITPKSFLTCKLHNYLTYHLTYQTYHLTKKKKKKTTNNKLSKYAILT